MSNNKLWSSDQELQLLFEGFRSWTEGKVLNELRLGSDRSIAEMNCGVIIDGLQGKATVQFSEPHIRIAREFKNRETGKVETKVEDWRQIDGETVRMVFSDFLPMVTAKNTSIPLKKFSADAIQGSLQPFGETKTKWTVRGAGVYSILDMSGEADPSLPWAGNAQEEIELDSRTFMTFMKEAVKWNSGRLGQSDSAKSLGSSAPETEY